MTLNETGRRVVTTGAQGQPGIMAFQTLQGLYSAAGIASAALPAQLTFFGYKIGDNVPGAGTAAGFAATEYHTNMQVGGQLPAPEMFTTTGVRVIMPLLRFEGANTPTRDAPDFGGAAQQSDILEDLKLFTYSTFLQFRVAHKLYADHPTWMFPGNVGFSGLAAVAQDDGTAATTGQLDVTLPHTCGMGFQMWPFQTQTGLRGPVFIAEQQSFAVTINCQWGTNPPMIQDRNVFVILDGQHTRASQ